MKERVIVDTNVVSYVFKGDSRARLYEKHLDQRQTFVSFATVADCIGGRSGRNGGASGLKLCAQTFENTWCCRLTTTWRGIGRE